MRVGSAEDRPQGRSTDDLSLSVDAIVEDLGVSRDIVSAWTAERGLPGHRVGRLWKFKKNAVDAWVQGDAAHVTRGTKEPERRERGTSVRRKR